VEADSKGLNLLLRRKIEAKRLDLELKAFSPDHHEKATLEDRAFKKLAVVISSAKRIHTLHLNLSG